MKGAEPLRTEVSIYYEGRLLRDKFGFAMLGGYGFGFAMLGRKLDAQTDERTRR